MSKDITVGIYVDWMAGAGMTMEEEMDLIEEDIQELLSKFNINFEKGLQPYELANKSIDMYVFDFGGLMPGCDDLVTSMYRELLKQIEDKPNTLFVIWSTFSKIYLEGEIRAHFDECKAREYPNVVYNLGHSKREEWTKKLQEWFK